LELWLVGCSQSYSFFPVTHKNFLAYYMCGISLYSFDPSKVSRGLKKGLSFDFYLLFVCF
jgi:hypothetical protein